jgi:hypothetical protein
MTTFTPGFFTYIRDIHGRLIDNGLRLLLGGCVDEGEGRDGEAGCLVGHLRFHIRRQPVFRMVRGGGVASNGE